MQHRLAWWQGLLVASAVTSTGIAAYSVFAAKGAVAKTFQSLAPPRYNVSGSPVSVIIPTLQEEDWIEPLLISIRNQTYQPIEIIISDSSPADSKQATAEIANHYGAIMISSPRNTIAAGRNRGAEVATGEILIFCDADCVMAPDFVERMVAVLEEGAVLAHGVDCIYDNSFRNTFWTFWRVVKQTSHTTGRGVAMRADDFFKIGGYVEECDPVQGCMEDILLGRMVIEHFGGGAVRLDRAAMVATSARRPLGTGRVWQERGWRNGVIPVEASGGGIWLRG